MRIAFNVVKGISAYFAILVRDYCLGHGENGCHELLQQMAVALLVTLVRAGNATDLLQHVRQPMVSGARRLEFPPKRGDKPSLHGNMQGPDPEYLFGAASVHSPISEMP